MNTLSVLLYFSLFPFIASAAEVPEAQPEWFACRKTKDCVVVGACGQNAVNRKYVDAWNATRVCTQVPAPDPLAYAACVKGKCALKTRRKK